MSRASYRAPPRSSHNDVPSALLTISDLPAVNATLNGIAALCLIAGFVMIKRRRPDLHKRCMLGALGASTLFLISYVVYHANAGSRPFTGVGAIRVVYFGILLTHVVLAALILPLALVTTSRGLREQYARHVRIARWTLPMWLYVSVTGVIIYLMLYQLY
jgi:putative membrane protein